MTEFTPAYVELLESGELARRVEAAYDGLRDCVLCAWDCHVDRRAGKIGFCKTGEQARVASYFAHMGEEDCLRGRRGSGTIFFGNCNMRCQYCQNDDLSHEGKGVDIAPERLAAMMLELQAVGCHNINFVSPSHVIAQILAGVLIAAQAGLRLPIVYNTGGYDSLAGLELLDGVVDIYMPDVKYADRTTAQKYSKILDYPNRNQQALLEMHRQVGDLAVDSETGVARRGMLIRHLVLPGDLAGTADVMRFLAEELSPDTFVNLMGQYRPAYKAATTDMGPLSRPVSRREMVEARRAAEKAGIHRFDERRRFFLIG